MSSFDNVDMAMSSMMSQIDNHVISDPYSILSEATAADRSNSIFRKDPEVYLDFLESWDFVQGLIDSFASPLKEVLNKNQIKVSFKSEELPKRPTVSTSIAEVCFTPVLNHPVYLALMLLIPASFNCFKISCA